MKTFSYKALRGLIDFSFVMFILSGVIFFIFLGMKWVGESPAEFTIGAGTTQTYNVNNSAVAIVSSSSEVSEATFVTSRVGIKFKTTSLLIKSFMTSTAVIRYLYMFVIIYCLRAFVHSLDKKNPFTNQNINRLKIIGLLLLLIEPLDWLGSYFADQIVDKHFIHTIFSLGSIAGKIGYWFGYNVGKGEFVSSWIIVGLIVLVIAEVFRQGLKIKEEQDLTI